MCDISSEARIFALSSLHGTMNSAETISFIAIRSHQVVFMYQSGEHGVMKLMGYY